MNPRRGILRFWGVFLALLALALGVITLIHRWHRVFPSSEVSEVYAHYENVGGIDASFVKKYRINDSVFVDVTMLQATTDSAWNKLKKDFHVPVIPKEYEKLFETGGVDVWRAPRDNPYSLITARSIDDYIVSVSRSTRTVCIFDTKNDAESWAVYIDQFNTIVN